MSVCASVARLTVGLLAAWALPLPDALASAPPVEPPAQVQIVDYEGFLDANEIGMPVTNVGWFAHHPLTVAGLEYPRGSGNRAVFAAGLWLGGIVGAELRVAVTEYTSEYLPGAILFGAPDDTSKAEYKVYKLYRTYISPVDRDLALADYSAGAVPYGAPAVFVQPDGSLSIVGDQMLWSICNDADALAHWAPGGRTAPLGVEVRQTTHADRLGRAGI